MHDVVVLILVITIVITDIIVTVGIVNYVDSARRADFRIVQQFQKQKIDYFAKIDEIALERKRQGYVAIV